MFIKIIKYVPVIISLVIFFNGFVNAGYLPPNKMEQPLYVFYDGSGLLFNYLRNDINIVSFVRNPSEAQVFIQLNSLPSGDGGRKYTFFFKGFKQFENINDTLSLSLPGNISDNEKNEQLVRLVKLGLIRYISRTPYNKLVDVIFNKNESKIPGEDVWDSWVFNFGLNGSVEAEEAKKEILWETTVDAGRITEDLKIKITGNLSNEIKKYKEDDETTTTYKKTRKLKVLYASSISNHFSAGFYTWGLSNTYENLKFSFNFSPAVEYNFFPYRESVRKNFTVRYRVGYVFNNYYDKTIFLKEKENLFQQSLKLDYSLNETWGAASFYLQASNYLHRIEESRVEFSSRLSFRLSGSFFFDFLASASYINDQVYLPQEKVSLEDILLNQKVLSTEYEYKMKFGISYTFGSIYNSVVNTRF